MSFTRDRLLTQACKNMNWVNYRSTNRFQLVVKRALVKEGYGDHFINVNLVYDEMEKIHINCETFTLAGVTGAVTIDETIEVDAKEYRRLVALAKCAMAYLNLIDCHACSKPRIKVAQACPHCNDPGNRYTIFN